MSRSDVTPCHVNHTPIGVGVDVAQGLMTRLEKEGLIKAVSKGKRLGKLINKDKVGQAMKKYLDRSNKPSDDKTTVASQEVCDMTSHCIMCYYN